jgi:hypothetical protein
MVRSVNSHCWILFTGFFPTCRVRKFSSGGVPGHFTHHKQYDVEAFFTNIKNGRDHELEILQFFTNVDVMCSSTDFNNLFWLFKVQITLTCHTLLYINIYFCCPFCTCQKIKSDTTIYERQNIKPRLVANFKLN